MRAVWVSYIEFNISSEKNTEKAFKNKFNKIIEDSKKHKISSINFNIGYGKLPESMVNSYPE